jgi:hypothetical protein
MNPRIRINALLDLWKHNPTITLREVLEDLPSEFFEITYKDLQIPEKSEEKDFSEKIEKIQAMISNLSDEIEKLDE